MPNGARVSWAGAALLVGVSLWLGACTDAGTETGRACAESDLVSQCPPGSNPVLGASAAQTCSGSVGVSVIEQSGSAVGQCRGESDCALYCQFVVPCTCGVTSVTQDGVFCAPCPDQSCGDGRCEGSERLTCDGAPEPCFPCPEDCGGPTCGDGDCTGDETPESCPQDCAALCSAGASFCMGNLLRVCAADGRASTDVDCAEAGLICAGNRCVPGAVCGNGVCDGEENPDSCPQDCATLCVPNAQICIGEVLTRCSADGQSRDTTDCAERGQICSNATCQEAGVCPNGRCEPGETPESCADCRATCGNGICEVTERETCPQDCTVCGNRVCEEGEQVSCPQDCGDCIPGSRTCLGAILSVCAANGRSSRDVDCGASEQICARGECVAPNVCGNGACEFGEFETCREDCVEVCGNGVCGPGETFETCANDCAPRCGDGACNGGETSATCPLDCLTTCGNGVCDAAEDRRTCSVDCGYCGDGICQDGYETAADRPVGGLEPCRIDCVRLTCSNDTDCDDRVACTRNRCVGGACVYTPDDALCDPLQRCLERAGCCDDLDQDGFTDVACGGSDCDDNNFDVRPGAFEVCGLGDMNCNGLHRPTVNPTLRQLTSNLTSKGGFDIALGGGQYLLTWFSRPGGTPAIEYALMNTSGVITRAETVLTRDHVTGCDHTGGCRTRILWDDTNAQWVVAWVDRNATPPLGRMLRVAADGTVSPAEPIALHDAKAVYSHSVCAQFCNSQSITVPTFHMLGFFADRLAFYAPSVVDATLSRISSAGDVTSEYLNGLGDHVSIEPDRITILQSLYIHMTSGPSGTSSVRDYTQNDGWQVMAFGVDGQQLYSNELQSEFLQHASAVAFEGETIFAVSSRGAQGLWFERFLLSGERIAHGRVSDRALTIAASLYRPSASALAIAATDGSSLYFLIHGTDGAQSLPAGLIATGTNIANVKVTWTGRDYRVFWTAEVAGLHQVFYTDVVCD